MASRGLAVSLFPPFGAKKTIRLMIPIKMQNHVNTDVLCVIIFSFVNELALLLSLAGKQKSVRAHSLPA